jgi:hypothetical protein
VYRRILTMAAVSVCLGACADGTVKSGKLRPVTVDPGQQGSTTHPDGGVDDPGATGGTGGFVGGGAGGSHGDPPGNPGSMPPPPPPPLQLVVSEPARGSWLSGPTIHVAGQLRNGQAPTLTVAGQPVALGPDGSFAADVPANEGLNVISTEAHDGTRRAEDRRAALVDADVDPGSLVERGAAVQVAPSGFDTISDLMSDYLQNLDLNSLIAGNVPDNVSIDELTYGRIGVQLSPEDGDLRVRLTVNNLFVRLTGTVHYGIDITFHGSATADPAEIIAHVRLDATNDGSLGVHVMDAEVNLNNFSYDIDHVPGFVEDWFQDRVRGFAEGLIRDALDSFVLPSLFDPSALDRSFEVFGRPIDVGLRIRDVDMQYSGMTMNLAARVAADQVVHPGAAVRSLGGQPQLGGDRDVDLALAADFIGRVLHAAWAGGMLDFTLGPDSGFQSPVPLTVGLLAPALGDAARGLDRSEPLIITTRPLLPAVARVDGGDHPLTIETGDLMLDLSTTQGPLVSVAVHLIAHANMTIDGLGSIEIHPDFQVEVHADVAETPRGPVNDARLEQQIETFAALIPPIIAQQTFTFGADALPVPISLSDVLFEADPGAPFVHLRANIAR